MMVLFGFVSVQIYCGSAVYKYSQPYFLSGMKPKSFTEASPRSPLHSHFQQPIYVGCMLDSAKKSSQVTHPTDRSSSRNKVMIPNSPKLANFFNSSRARSAHKSPSTTCTDAANRGEEPQKQKKIQFLKYNLNKDYFDEISQQDIKGRTQRQRRWERGNQNTCLNRQSAYKSETLIRADKAVQFRKVKQPHPKQLPHKIFAKPIERMKQMKKGKSERVELQNCAGQRLNRDKNSLEYTFGLNY